MGRILNLIISISIFLLSLNLLANDELKSMGDKFPFLEIGKDQCTAYTILDNNQIFLITAKSCLYQEEFNTKELKLRDPYINIVTGHSAGIITEWIAKALASVAIGKALNAANVLNYTETYIAARIADLPSNLATALEWSDLHLYRLEDECVACKEQYMQKLETLLKKLSTFDPLFGDYHPVQSQAFKIDSRKSIATLEVTAIIQDRNGYVLNDLAPNSASLDEEVQIPGYIEYQGRSILGDEAERMFDRIDQKDICKVIDTNSLRKVLDDDIEVFSIKCGGFFRELTGLQGAPVLNKNKEVLGTVVDTIFQGQNPFSKKLVYFDDLGKVCSAFNTHSDCIESKTVSMIIFASR